MGFDSDQSGNSSVVEHRLAKARVAGSNPVSRSKLFKAFRDIIAEGFFVTPGFTPGSELVFPA